MSTATARTFPISFSRGNAFIMRVLLIRPQRCVVTVSADTVAVRFEWGFRAAIPTASVRDPRPGKRVLLTAGVHGWRGRWLVNGAGTGIVTFDIEPPVRATMFGLPLLRVHELSVSVEDPDGLIEELTRLSLAG